MTTEEIFADRDIAAVAIATRHKDHAQLVTAALAAGKAVFVEKPLCMTAEELAEIMEMCLLSDTPPLQVGFNRRFSPAVQSVVTALPPARGPAEIVIRVNAGPLPADHWLNDPAEGGGRLLGEGCHFVDLACTLAGCPPIWVSALGEPASHCPLEISQDFVISIGFADGTLACVAYTSRGDTSQGKEFVEVHRGGRSTEIRDFRDIASRRILPMPFRHSPDKGHASALRAFRALANGQTQSNPAQDITAMRVTFAALQSMRLGRVLALTHGDP